jgi:ABC-2 type transport system ATP-binding protein
VSTLLQISDLSKSYGKIKALQNVSFSIEKGKVYGILGPNGSGKSTTLGIILEVVNASSGSFSWFDGSMTTHEARKKVGALLERPNFYPYMSAYQNLKLVCQIKGINESQIEKTLELVGLAERKHSAFKGFSLGMKQRLAIASALLSNPEILILDEPTNGLDPQGIRQIRDLIIEIAKTGTTILLASHLLDEVEKVCTDVIILQRGVMKYKGNVSEMLAQTTYIEVQTSPNDSFKEVISNMPNFLKYEEKDGLYYVYFKNEPQMAEINSFLFRNGLTATHLRKRHLSLEEHFITMTVE